MKVWLPYVLAGSGIDVYTHILARALKMRGCEVVTTPIEHKWQYFPWRLRYLSMPQDTDIILTNSWNGFAFARKNAKLVVVEHHCVFDPAFLPYRSAGQRLFHELLIRGFERVSFGAADEVLAVSQYTSDSVRQSMGVDGARVIRNGIDTDFYSPGIAKAPRRDREPFRILFVGNPSRRKGADLLAPIMTGLGDGFELRYTGGLRNGVNVDSRPNLVCVGRLDEDQLREEYRRADVLLFPSRLEGFGYVAAEAMACGTPVVASNRSSLPEVVEDKVTGLLCPMDEVGAFVEALSELRDDPGKLERFGTAARARAVAHFSLDRMADEYMVCFGSLMPAG